MPALNLPEFQHRTRNNRNGKPEIFDTVRKKFVRLTPEEWVRQHFLNFLVGNHGYPASLIHVEASVKYHNLSKRSDIVIYGNNGKPLMAVECKAPSVEISQKTFSQLAMYNFTLRVSYLVLTNGLSHYVCRMDAGRGTFSFLEEFPDYTDLRDQFQDL